MWSSYKSSGGDSRKIVDNAEFGYADDFKLDVDALAAAAEEDARTDTTSHHILLVEPVAEDEGLYWCKVNVHEEDIWYYSDKEYLAAVTR